MGTLDEMLRGLLYQEEPQPRGLLGALASQPAPPAAPPPTQGLLGALYQNPLMARQVAAQRSANPRPDVTDLFGYGPTWQSYAQNLNQNLQAQIPQLGDSPEAMADKAIGMLGNFGAFGMTSKVKPKPVREVLRDKYPDVRTFVSEGVSDPYNRNVWRLDDLVVPEKMRGQGVGSKVMGDLVSEADKAGAVIKLSPASPSDNMGTASKARLIEFYKRFGFVENKGRNADQSILEMMYRLPRK
jgi:GNAT superfamily N-acetyltransferase